MWATELKQYVELSKFDPETLSYTAQVLSATGEKKQVEVAQQHVRDEIEVEVQLMNGDTLLQEQCTQHSIKVTVKVSDTFERLEALVQAASG